MRFLPPLLSRAVRTGALTVIDPDGMAHSFGDGTPPSITLRLHDPALDWRLMLNPQLHGAEAWMDGTLTLEQGDVYDLVALFYRNKPHFDRTPTQQFWHQIGLRAQRWWAHNTIARARANAQAHYDVGNDLYAAMLDRDMQYSCGYWPEGVETLEDAQTAKKRRIAAKLALEPGMRVLDIGCGWGGMALYLAALHDVEVTGITLAAEQHKVAVARAEALGLSNRVRFELRDYREVRETYDRVVSVGMMEHVGVGHLPAYFRTVRDRLSARGVALIHSIVTRGGPGVSNAFIRRYIFPGGYIPALSETFSAIEQSGLWPLDLEIWRLHYARTLHAWRENFHAARDRLHGYDDRFKRMWDFYLAGCEAAFRFADSCVAQVQLGRERDSVPIARDYIGAAEARLAEAEPEYLPRIYGSTERALAA